MVKTVNVKVSLKLSPWALSVYVRRDILGPAVVIACLTAFQIHVCMKVAAAKIKLMVSDVIVQRNGLGPYAKMVSYITKIHNSFLTVET